MRRRLRFPSAVFESGGRYDFGDGQGAARWGGQEMMWKVAKLGGVA